VHEVTTLVIVAVTWVRCGFGTTLRTPAGQARVQPILNHYAIGLVDATKRALGVEIVTEGLDDALLEGGPLLVFVRHTSLMDSALPVDVMAPYGFGFHYVIKSALKWAPMFDVGGHMLPVHFVDRTGTKTSSEMEAIEDLASRMGDHNAMVVFPEGTFFNLRRRERALERIREDAPHLVERAAKLQYSLPPRAGGALAMLEGAPTADVVFLAHSGLERFNSLGNIVRNVPLHRPVHITMWRVKRGDIPSDPRAQYDWLFAEFERVDRVVIEQLGPRPLEAAPAG
jgi:1-acyl-sn-glycerol-3-phosphate acyltransferase